ncbi:MAG: peptidylprolyl isomerase [Desulfobacterales bacterium]|nr:peptidylprolyl isomerase [Desulfobacterales bacterium]
MKKFSSYTLPALLALLLLAAPVLAEVPADITMEDSEHPLVKMTTDQGVVYLELFPEVAPIHVDNFLALAKKGFYNGLSFHRVEQGTLIQGGCPEGTGRGGPGYTIPAEFNFRRHKRGTLAMARGGHPDSAGSQFYICLKGVSQLDGKYTVFGQVVKGMNVPDKIRKDDRMIVLEIIQGF